MRAETILVVRIALTVSAFAERVEAQISHRYLITDSGAVAEGVSDLEISGDGAIDGAVLRAGVHFGGRG